MAVKFQKGTGDEQEFQLPEKGARPARLIGVVDVGIQKRDSYQGQTKKPCQQIYFFWDLVEDLVDYGEGEAPFRISSGYFPMNLVINRRTGLPSDKSKVYEIIKALDPELSFEEDGLDFEKLMNEPCLITVNHVEGKGKNQGRTFANYGGISPAPSMKGVVISDTPHDPFLFDFDAPTMDGLKALPMHIRAKIRESINYKDSDVQAMDEILSVKESKEGEESES